MYRINVMIVTVFTFLLLFMHQPALASFGSKLCQKPQYDCYKVKSGDTWNKLFDNPELKNLVMKINRINVRLKKGMIIAIPKDDYTIDLLSHSPLPTQINPPGKKMITVSTHPTVLAWGAYDADGNLQNWGPVGGGKKWCPDVNRRCRTVPGKFTIYNKQGSGCASSKYPLPRGGAPMPYCMFFYKGYALHGSHDVPGYNASHGCVRLFVSDAKWLNKEFTAGEKRVSVIVKTDH